MAIANAMRLSEYPVNTHALGATYSSGATIVAAGTGKRTAYEGSRFMLHEIDVTPQREFSASRLLKEGEQTVAEFLALADLMSKFTRQPLHNVKADMRECRWFTEREAMKYGLVDEVKMMDGKKIRDHHRKVRGFRNDTS